VEDLKCRRDNIGDANDEIFYRGECRTIDWICQNNTLVGVNENYCLDVNNNVNIAISDVINRTLSTEEFF
jgi:hypothetical protein